MPVCVGEIKAVKKSKKTTGEELLELDPDGDGYYTKYDTKCMKIDDIEKLILEADSSDKYIESCGCCSIGLEDEQSQYCHNNIFFHHGDGAAAGVIDDGTTTILSMSPSMHPSSSSSVLVTTSGGKGSKLRRSSKKKNRKKIRH